MKEPDRLLAGAAPTVLRSPDGVTFSLHDGILLTELQIAATAAATPSSLATGFATASTEDRGSTPAALAIAWTLAQGDHVIAIPGTALFLLILSVNMLGDGVRDVTAPENRN